MAKAKVNVPAGQIGTVPAAKLKSHTIFVIGNPGASRLMFQNSKDEKIKVEPNSFLDVYFQIIGNAISFVGGELPKDGSESLMLKPGSDIHHMIDGPELYQGNPRILHLRIDNMTPQMALLNLKYKLFANRVADNKLISTVDPEIQNEAWTNYLSKMASKLKSNVDK